MKMDEDWIVDDFAIGTRIPKKEPEEDRGDN